MWTILLAPLAFAGTVVIDARIPVEVWLGDRLIGELANPAEIHAPADPGPVDLTLMISGKPYKTSVQVPESGAALVIVGRTGITTGVREMPEPPPTTATSTAVEFRSAGREDVVLVVGSDRMTLSPGTTKKVDVPIGTIPLSIRDGSGTVVWAHGKLDVGGEGLVVQVADGHLPETAGAGAFHPDP